LRHPAEANSGFDSVGSDYLEHPALKGKAAGANLLLDICRSRATDFFADAILMTVPCFVAA
jgi:hypothetical protein